MNDNGIPPSIRVRLKALPRAQAVRIREQVIATTGCSRQKWERFISGYTKQLDMMLALEAATGITVSQIVAGDAFPADKPETLLRRG